MTKRMMIPSNYEIEQYKEVDAYLFGLQDYSVNFDFVISIEELSLMIKKAEEKEIFVSINKNFTNSELSSLRDLLCILNTLPIHGIFYYDVAVLKIVKDLGLSIPLVWAADHLVTNYATIQYWKQKGISYALLSGELTKEEILEIKENTDVKLIVPIFGYLPMFFSKRHEIRNYLHHFHIQENHQQYYLKKEGVTYPVIENQEGTVIFSGHILNGYQEYLEMEQHNIGYVLLNSYLIEEQKMKQVLSIFQNKIEHGEEQIRKMFSNIDKGFLYKETVYKVKNYEEK